MERRGFQREITRNFVMEASYVANRASGHPTNASQVVQTQIVAHAPGNVVIRAGSVPAYTNASDDILAGRIQCKAAAENVHASGLSSNHGSSR